MVIGDFYVGGVIVFSPREADAPLLIDADAVLAFAAAFQAFETQAGERGKVGERGGGVELGEALESDGLHIVGKFAGELAARDFLRFFIGEAFDHASR